MSDIKLKWGPRTISVPDGVRAAWGARLIFPDDVVWNRCDCDGEQEEKDALLAWLNGTVGARPWEHARVMAANGLLHAGGSEQVTLYEDDRGVVLASPQRSHGYLYAIAYLKPGADTACKRACATPDARSGRLLA